jgi:hypothetical protein
MRNLNQYVIRTVPGVVDLLGSADPAAHVTFNDQPTTRQDIYWHAQMDVDNAELDVFEQFHIVGVLNDQEPSGEDAVGTDSRTAYVPAASQPFTYDDDGNLTGDSPRRTPDWKFQAPGGLVPPEPKFLS